MSTKGKPQRRAEYVAHVQGLRKGNAAQPHRNRAKYTRKGRQALDYRRDVW